MNYKRNKQFYSNFFKKKTFLNFDNHFYNKEKYINSLGFAKNLFYQKTVLEIGAGTGRLFLSLQELSYLKKIKKYIVSEPSSALDFIKYNCKTKNVFFKKKSFEKLIKDKNLYKKFDLLIFSGVIPHIDNSFEYILKKSKLFLKNNGKIIINHSFYGLEKSIDYKLKKINIRNNLFVYFLTFIKTFLSYFLTEKVFKFYFLFSLETNLIRRFLQFYEFYFVNPYKIFFNYKY